MNVTVNDDEDPAITCPANINVFSDMGSCDAAVVVPPLVAADNCGIASIVNDYNGTTDASDDYPIGTTTVIWTVTDIHGNVTNCSLTITVGDDEDPTIVCPADQNVAFGPACSFTLPSYAALAVTADNCDASLTITQSPVAGTIITGTTTITLTATDDAGNATSCTFQVIPTDQTVPSITCPANQTVALTAACNYTLLSYTALAVTADNCDASVTVTQSPAAGTVITATTTITLTATDDAGNSTTCTFQVIPTDQTAPSITCPGSQNVVFTTSCNFTLPSYT
ncbi:MAG: HYR domain-containing protein, partial [Bacteroidota bacterium]